MTLKSGEYLGFFNKWQQPSCFYLWCGLWPGEAVGTSCSTEGFPLPVPQTGTKLRIEPIAYSESTLSNKWQLSFGKPWKHNSTEREEIWITQESCLIFNLLSQQHSETHTSYWENSHKHSHYFCKGRICYIAKCFKKPTWTAVCFRLIYVTFPLFTQVQQVWWERSCKSLSSQTTNTSLFYSPFFPNERNIEFISLQVFSWVAHDLVKGIF